MDYSFTATVWKYAGDAAWYFVTLPQKYTEEIKSLHNPNVKNFGSLRVTATIGQMQWQTSIFPDTKSEAYVLPIKKEVRKANGIEGGGQVDVLIKLVDI